MPCKHVGDNFIFPEAEYRKYQVMLVTKLEPVEVAASVPLASLSEVGIRSEGLPSPQEGLVTKELTVHIFHAEYKVRICVRSPHE